MGLTPPNTVLPPTPAQPVTPSVPDALTTCLANLKSASEQSAILQEQVTKLQGELTALQNLYTDSKKKYEEVQSSLVLAKKQIVENETEDINWAEKAFSLEKENDSIKDFVAAFADVLDIKTAGLQTADIVEKCLTKLKAEEEIVQKSHISLQILQELGHEVVLKVEEMSPVQIGTQIMSWIRQHKYSSTPPASQKGRGGFTKIAIALGLWQEK